jgi:soluble cytochrome b562
VVTGRASDRSEVPPHPVTELDLTRMAKHKEQITAQVAVASQELERLRRRQEELERERRALEEMSRRQTEYEQGKSDMIDNLNQSIAWIEKQEVQAVRMSEIYAGTRQRFKEMLQSLQRIDETAWPEETIREEVNKALVLVDDVRKEYHKGLAKMEASGGADGGRAEAPGPVPGHVPSAAGPAGFVHWLKVGVAVTLPLMLVIAVLLVAFVVITWRR